MRETKCPIATQTRGGLPFTIPEGTLVKPIRGEPGKYWVDPSVFPKDSIERHDAVYYGLRVSHEMTRKRV
jgi:hypothetical protein